MFTVTIKDNYSKNQLECISKSFSHFEAQSLHTIVMCATPLLITFNRRDLYNIYGVNTFYGAWKKCEVQLILSLQHFTI